MHDGFGKQHEHDDVHWDSAMGFEAAKLQPDGHVNASGPQETSRERIVAFRALLETSGNQAVAGIALYALCTLCSSGKRRTPASPFPDHPMLRAAFSVHPGSFQLREGTSRRRSRLSSRPPLPTCSPSPTRFKQQAQAS